MFKLHVYSQSGDLDQQIEVEGDSVIIGRSSDCHVVIDRKDISRRHARLLFGWVVDDLSSRNGTHVDGEKIDKATLVPSRSFEVGDPTSQNLVTIELVGSDLSGPKPRETSNPEVMEATSDSGAQHAASAPAPEPGMGLAETKSRAMLEAEAARYRYKCAKLELEIVQLRKKLESLGQPDSQGSATVELKGNFKAEKLRGEPPKSEGSGG